MMTLLWNLRIQCPVVGVMLMLSLVTMTTDAKEFPKVLAYFQGHCNELSPCHQLCIDLPKGGYECACKDGFVLHSNGFSCEEVHDADNRVDPDSPESKSKNQDDEESETAETVAYIKHSGKYSDLEKSLEDLAWEKSLANEDDGEEEEEESNLENGDLGDQEEVMQGDAPFVDDDDVAADSKLQNIDRRGYYIGSVQPNFYQQDGQFANTGGAGLDRGKGKGRGRNKGKGQGRNKGKGRGRGRKLKNKHRQKVKGGNHKSGSYKHTKINSKPSLLPLPFSKDGTVNPDFVKSQHNMKVQSSTAPTSLTTGAPPSTADSNRLIAAGVRFATCAELQCQAGGRCVPDKLRGGVRCQCRLGSHGEFCERDVVVRNPRFMGNGYIAFPVLRGAYKDMSIIMEFRPETQNGLLLFSAGHPYARSDFVSITLTNGNVEFRFDCGTGMAQIQTKDKVKLGAWNTLKVGRSDAKGWIQLNEGTVSRGMSKGRFTRITFLEDLYLGGYKNNTLVGSRTGMRWGYVGCVRYLEINNRIYDMRKGAFVGDAIHGVDVDECSAHVCDNVRCHNGGSCVADSADTHSCLCPLGTAGDRCEKKIDIHVPEFTGSSYLQFIGLRRTVLSYTDVEIVLKPLDKDGLIFYNGYTTDRSGDFISLGLVDGYVEFTFDLGTGPAKIRSRQPIEMNRWHKIQFRRTGRNGHLQIDTHEAVQGMAMGAYTQLTLTLDLFIGGHRNFDEVATHCGIRKSFRGCIQKVVINERPKKLLEEPLTGVNIDNCDHPCVGQPCMNGGRCMPINDIYKCHCPIGFENTNCEDRKARREIIKPIKVPQFTGDSFLEYLEPHMAERLRGDKFDIRLRFRATKPDGLLFWTGEEDMTTSSDFVSMGLKGGHVQLSYNLGSGEVVIPYNRTRLDDGKWHRIHVQRDRRVGYLEVDGTEAVEGTSPGNLKQLNTDSRIFIGGMNNVNDRTLRKYFTGFTGCISDITLGTDLPIDLIGDVAEGQNIQQCTEK